LAKPLPKYFVFFARTSFCSLFSNPIEPPIINLASKWQNEMVAADFSKIALPSIVGRPPDVLLLDLIDERFSLYEVKGTIVTYSFELARSGAIGSLCGRFISRHSAEADKLWCEALNQLSSYVSSPPLAHTRIILHKAKWASEYVDGGIIKQFNNRQKIFDDFYSTIFAENELLDRYYSDLHRCIPRIEEVSVPQTSILATTQAKWGLSPFHYTPEYYKEIVAKLDRLNVKLFD
jgi:hypothetical protein